MNPIVPRNWSGRLGLFVVLLLLLAGVAAVTAQSGPPDPNQPVDQGPDTPANALSPDEMAGRSPNDVGLDAASQGDADNTLAPAAMAGESPNDGALESALAPGVQNALPVEEMVGRSPNGEVAGEDAGQAAPSGEAAPDAAALAADERVLFFITLANVNGAAADTTCPAGYHMANLYELSDPTNLVYVSSPSAKVRADQGTGPVAGWWGWVRTGVDSSVANVAGQANCANWTSTTGGQYGTIAQLTDNWTATGVAISPWRAQTWSCGGIAPVWCVAD